GLLRDAWRTRPEVVRAVGARSRTTLLDRRLLADRHPPGGDQERRVTDHRVPRADRQALDVPVAHQRLPGLRLGEPAVYAHALDEARELGRGGDVRAHDAAGPQRPGRRLEAVPGRQ